MKRGRIDQRGFTIVELLIVIVVIAILAAISVVAYNGVQNRTNDAAIQSDLSNFAKKIRLAEADTGIIPVAGAIRTAGVSTGNATAFSGFTYSPSKAAYATNTLNLFYCSGVSGGTLLFNIAARSKSGIAYRYRSNIGLESMGNTGVNEVNSCVGLDDGYSWAYGYNSSTSVWNGWANN